MVDAGKPIRDEPPATPTVNFSAVTAGGIVVAIGALYFGQDIFVPFALAILITFALAPLVNWLRRLKLPKIAAVLIAVSLAVVLIAGVAYVVGRQLIELANNLPTYQTTITQKIRSLQQSSMGGGVVAKVTTTIEDLGKEISGDKAKPEGLTSGTDTRAGPQEPVTVRLEAPQTRPFEIIQTVVGPLLSPLATAGLVAIFVIFVLLERETLRDRFIKLVGAGDIQKTTHAISDAGARVSRYLLMQLVVNSTYGVPIGLGLYFIGVPNAVLWGLLAAVLRFIPYLGPFLAALFPITLAVAVDPGWTMLLWVLALFIVAELISNNVIEPWLYGSSTGLSSLAIIVAAIFWTSLWGSAGLFLATPLTVCLVVIGRYVPQLEFLGVLLGSEPVLAPEERLYQRLLAGNLEEAVEIAEEYVDQHSSRDFYENVAIPALRIAENDGQRNTADTNVRRRVAHTAISIVGEVRDHIRDRTAADKPSQDPAAARRVGPDDLAAGEEPKADTVLCIAGRSELDRAAAEMQAEVLHELGIGARVLAPIAVSEGALGQLDLKGVSIVSLSYFHPQPQVYARYICRRLRRRAPDVKLIVCPWNYTAGSAQTEDLASRMAADAVFTSLHACIDQIIAWSTEMRSDHEAPSAAIDNERAQLRVLHELGLSRARGRNFDDVSRDVAQAFDVPIAIVSFVDKVRRVLPGTVGERDQASGSNREPREVSLDAQVIAADELLVSEDVTKDPRFADDPRLLEKGIRFFAGVPLRNSAGVVVGSLSVVDTKPRKFSEADGDRLQMSADSIMAGIEHPDSTPA